MSAVSELILVARQASDPQAALGAWERAFRAEPDNSEARLGYAEALLGAARPEDAIRLLEGAIPTLPDPVPGLVLLGEACVGAGRYAQAVAAFERACLFEPDVAVHHNNLAVACMALGRLEDALRAAQRAVELAPDDIAARCNLATITHRLGRMAESEAQCRRAVELAPDDFEVLDSLAATLESLGRTAEAATVLERCAALAPENLDTQRRLGASYFEIQDWQGTERSFRRVAEGDPRDLNALIKRGAALIHLQRWEEACDCYRKALALAPGHQEATEALPFCLFHGGYLDEAKPLIDRALAAFPHSIRARLLRCVILRETGDTKRALAELRAVLRDDPENVYAHQHHALWLLSLGRYREGWPEYQWREEIRLRNQFARTLGAQAAPAWDGAPLPGKTLLVRRGQGLGDAILFARYLPLVRERVGRLIVLVPPSLAPLFAPLDCVDEVISRSAGETGAPIQCDAEISFASLPGIFGTTVETIPGATPYLAADPARVETWRARIEANCPPNALKVGLVWAGAPTFTTDRLRSPGLAALAPLAGVPGVRFYSLQLGAGRKQLAQSPQGLEITDLGPDIRDFADTAAALKCLDLMITSCTSSAHLAGALRVPTWIALHYAPYWLWMLDREDSPWYPGVRLFRQPRPGDWDSVFSRIATELKVQAGC